MFGKKEYKDIFNVNSVHQNAYEELRDFVIDFLRDSNGELLSEQYQSAIFMSDAILLKGIFLKRLMDKEKENRRLMLLAKQVKQGQLLLKKKNSKK